MQLAALPAGFVRCYKAVACDESYRIRTPRMRAICTSCCFEAAPLAVEAFPLTAYPKNLLY